MKTIYDIITESTINEAFKESHLLLLDEQFKKYGASLQKLISRSFSSGWTFGEFRLSELDDRHVKEFGTLESNEAIKYIKKAFAQHPGRTVVITKNKDGEFDCMYWQYGYGSSHDISYLDLPCSTYARINFDNRQYCQKSRLYDRVLTRAFGWVVFEFDESWGVDLNRQNLINDRSHSRRDMVPLPGDDCYRAYCENIIRERMRSYKQQLAKIRAEHDNADIKKIELIVNECTSRVNKAFSNFAQHPEKYNEWDLQYLMKYYSGTKTYRNGRTEGVNGIMTIVTSYLGDYKDVKAGDSYEWQVKGLKEKMKELDTVKQTFDSYAASLGA